MDTVPITPLEKNVILVGAGNAHLVFVRRFAMRPMPGVAVTLVNESPVIPYSAMVPGHIAGSFARDDITIDLVRLCRASGVRFLAEPVTGIDPLARRVSFAQRPPLVYDALSIGLGSLPACSADLGEASLFMRPMMAFLKRLDDLDEDLRRSPRPFQMIVVGGGASGCELSLAIHQRFGKHPGFGVTLLQGGPQLLPEFPQGVARRFAEVFQQRGIPFRLSARVVGGGHGKLQLEGGERLGYDAVLWATPAAPPAMLRDSGLAVDSSGFLRVADSLQSIAGPAVFGTGDCVAFESHPGLPRNGVYAVRQGAVLFDNIGAFLREEPLRPFRPQARCLCLLNTADGDAILRYGKLVCKGRWARRLKDRIDRKWMRMLRPVGVKRATSAEEPEHLMRCGGCGSKISSDVLSAVLKRIDIPDDPRVLLGCRAGEDASVHRVRPEMFGDQPDKLVEVQTVDYFKAFIDDPYLFGRIAALNSVSDLYAMNARPFTALAIATLPYARGPVQEAQLFELLSGAVNAFRELGVVLTGGHTTEGNELALGFAVTGFGEEDRLFRKSHLQPGDRLVLTKPLGSGALLAAWMRGDCKAEWFQPLLGTMLIANARAGAIFGRAGVRACTDITGFGLAGHLLEMLDASGVSARLRETDVPVYRGFHEVVAAGITSTLHPDNAKTSCRVTGPSPLPGWLFDPQTSGGLLGAVKAESVESVLAELRAAGYPDATVIGEIEANGGTQSPTVFVV